MVTFRPNRSLVAPTLSKSFSDMIVSTKARRVFMPIGERLFNDVWDLAVVPERVGQTATFIRIGHPAYA